MAHTNAAEVKQFVHAQLTAFAEKGGRSGPHTADHFVLKLDHACGGLKAPPRKRQRHEQTTTREALPPPPASIPGLFFLDVRDAIEDVCGETPALRNVLVESTRTVQARHCCLTEACVGDAADDDAVAPTRNITLSTLFFTSALCTSWAEQLTCLDLECNALGDEGLRRLSAHLLPRLPQLESLHLASNEIGLAGLEALMLWTRTATTCTVDERETAALPCLRVLGLTNNPLLRSTAAEEPVSDAVDLATLLTTVLRRWRQTIRRIHLNHVGLDAPAVAALLAALSSSPGGVALPCLETLYMKQNTNLSRATLQAEVQKRVSDAQCCEEALQFADAHLLLE